LWTIAKFIIVRSLVPNSGLLSTGYDRKMSSELDTTASRPFIRHGDEPFQRPTANIHTHDLAQYSPKAAEAFSIPVPATKLDTPPLFQTPQLPLASICPQRWPGIDAESTKVLLRLKDNHYIWHIFFNYKGFHKCAPVPCVYLCSPV
jgi:hypothetical protein